MARGSLPGERRGGRAPGTPNRATAEVADRLATLGFDPIAAMVAIATDPAADLTLRGRMASELAAYIHPKRRAIDLTAETGSPGLTVVIRRFGEDEPDAAPAGQDTSNTVNAAA
jgi:hypothetical protein